MEIPNSEESGTDEEEVYNEVFFEILS